MPLLIFSVSLFKDHLLNRLWAKAPFPGPFVSVGAPSGDTSGDQAGLLVVRDEYP